MPSGKLLDGENYSGTPYLDLSKHCFIAFANGVRVGFFTTAVCAARSAIFEAGVHGTPVVIGSRGRPEDMEELRRRILDADYPRRNLGGAA